MGRMIDEGKLGVSWGRSFGFGQLALCKDSLVFIAFFSAGWRNEDVSVWVML